MIKCIYTIHIPGQGKIEIPSDHGLFVNNNDGTSFDELVQLNSLLDQLKDLGTVNSKEAKETLGDIRALVNKVSSLNNLRLPELNLELTNDEIISGINNLIIENSSSNFYKSLKNYLFKNTDKYSELLSKTSGYPTLNYFKEIITPEFIKTNRILRTSNINSEINYWSSKIRSHNDGHINNIVNFLTALNIDKNANTLLGFSTEFGLKSVNKDNYTFYKHGDIDSLFMSLFKKVSSNVDLYELNYILENNKLPKVNNVSDFFENKIDDNIIDNSDFENLLLDSKNNKVVSEIISLIGSHLKPDSKFEKDKLVTDIKNIFKNLNPSTFGQHARMKMMVEQSFNESEKKLNSSAFDKMTINFGIINGSFRANTADEKYSLAENLGSTEYLTVKNKIEEGRDIVQFPIGDKTPYVLVTKIYQRPEGVHIYGIYQSDTKGFVPVNKKFLGDESIIFRKYEGDLDPVSENELIETSSRTLNMNITKDINSQEVIKDYIRKGDTITKGKDVRTVVGVYPGYVLTDTGQKYKYTEISSFQSNVLYNIFENDLSRKNIKGYLKLDNSDLITKNDIIEDPRPEANGRKATVVATSENLLHIISGSNDNRFVITVNRSDVKKAWMYAFNVLTSPEISLIENTIHNSVIKSSDTLSRFTNRANVQKGDYFYGTIQGQKVIGKVLNDNKIIYKNNKLSETPLVGKTLDSLDSDVVFFTNRNIRTQYFLSGIRMNNWHIDFLSKPGEKNVELKYIVPEGTNVDSLILIPGNYANVGMWVEKTYNRPNTIDVTKQILNLINLDESGIKTEGLKPYGRVKYVSSRGFNVMSRNTSSTQEIYGFSELSNDVKKELNVLHPGTYISVIGSDGKLNHDIYRIIDVSSTEVVAHLNKTNNNGDIITHEKIFKVEDLLHTSTSEIMKPGTIHTLYVQNGNNRLNTIFTTIQNRLNIDQLKNFNNLNSLVEKMKEFYTPLGVKIIVDFSGENFNNNQRAMIRSDESGMVSIVLNGLKGDKSDLIHENLHIILTSLRTHDLDAYGRLINSIVEEDLDVYQKEEKFVELIVDKVKDGSFEALGNNLQVVMNGLLEAVKTINADFDMNLDNLNINPYKILNTKIKDIFNIGNNYSSPYYDTNVLQTEPAFRNWMKDNVTLKCV